MSMRGLARYVMADVVRGQGWVAPALTFGAMDAVNSAQAGTVLPAFAISATALVFIGAWLTVVVVNHEDPFGQYVTEATAGSRTRVRLSKLTVAYVLTAGLGLVGLVGPVLGGASITFTLFVQGAGAQLITPLAGVAIGSVCSRPIVTRRAWSLLLGALVCLVTVITPHGVPSRQLLVLFNATAHTATALPLLGVGVETLLAAAALVAASSRVSLRRA
ncbi:MAG TPA: hypothetical protein VL961_12405 [Acidimicrobiales bacterium]|nr:hypothetical protein [Acidimicrobiales bacterium]